MHHALEFRLRQAFATTSEAVPRPLSDIGVPAELAERWLAPDSLALLRPAAVLTAILVGPDGPSVLLTRRSDQLRTHSGQVSFPGGRRDAGDRSAADAALREAEEEVGLAREQVEVIGYLDDYPTLTRFLITPVVGLVRGRPKLRLDPMEVAEAFEVPLSVVLDPERYRRLHYQRDGIDASYLELDFAGQRVWGATAGMLWDLCRKLNSP